MKRLLKLLIMMIAPIMVLHLSACGTIEQKHSPKQISLLASESIEVIDNSFDSKYLKTFKWPAKLNAGTAAIVAPAIQTLHSDALECFIIHNALVNQIKAND